MSEKSNANCLMQIFWELLKSRLPSQGFWCSQLPLTLFRGKKKPSPRLTQPTPPAPRQLPVHTAPPWVPGGCIWGSSQGSLDSGNIYKVCRHFGSHIQGVL